MFGSSEKACNEIKEIKDCEGNHDKCTWEAGECRKLTTVEKDINKSRKGRLGQKTLSAKDTTPDTLAKRAERWWEDIKPKSPQKIRSELKAFDQESIKAIESLHTGFTKDYEQRCKQIEEHESTSATEMISTKDLVKEVGGGFRRALSNSPWS